MKLLVEKERVISVKSEVVKDGFRYDVSYNFNGNQLNKLACNIYTEDNQYSGYMNLENGSTNMNFPEEDDMASHVVLFNAIVAEVREEIKTEEPEVVKSSKIEKQ